MNKRLQAYIFHEKEKGWQAHISDRSTGYSVQDPSPYFDSKENAITWARDKNVIVLVIDQL